ncbi:hypothetical protein [Haloactinomyces albus]|uniref:Uncharacterized protein n=1 Tax=Haloactinomyces albus TaxID=1352928 RepID=A0AAE4CN75_9ACTN|nr:hypothetical protein [Haloactinomyces albus]MDR7303609.1 hypothetical protein [Haloactinomyces albus]
MVSNTIGQPGDATRKSSRKVSGHAHIDASREAFDRVEIFSRKIPPRKKAAAKSLWFCAFFAVETKSARDGGVVACRVACSISALSAKV